MKYKIFTVFLTAFIFLTILSLSDANSQPSQRMKHGFYIGANGGYLYYDYFWMYKELGYRTNVDWGFQGDYQIMYDPNRLYGGFFDPLSFYYPSVSNMLNRWYDTIYSLNSAFLRSSKIDRPAFGQRSTYQTEYDSALLINKSIRPGYGYLTRQIGNNYSETWMGEQVSGRVCYVIPDGQNRDPNNSYIVKQLYENNEQTNVITRRDYGNAYYSDRKRIGDNFRWYIKPRMRIDTAIANNPANQNKKVVRVEIFNYDSIMLPPIDINVSNFLDANHYYYGNYLEMFNFSGNPPYYPLSVLGDELATDNIDTSAYYTPRDSSRVDYRIYWYGEVDVWLDYIQLDDEWAHYLFNETFPNNRYNFTEKIMNEVNSFSNISGFGYFYFDEFYYNNIPCLKEVLRLIKYYNPNAGIIFLSPPAGYTGTGQGAGIKNELTLQEMYDYLNSQGLYADFVANDEYTFFDDTPLPPNIRKPSPTEFPGTIMYRNATSSGQYDDTVNTNVLSFRPTYQIDANLIKNDPNKVFVATIQAHTIESNFLYCPCDSIPNMERKREPTNEEISLQAFYAMTYGAKQIHYFTQFSGRVQKVNCPGNPYYYDWGLTYFDTDSLQRRRDTNYYGQHKWNYVQKLDSNLIKIGKYMYEQKDLKYDNTISINNGERYKYISDLKSYYRNPSEPYLYSSANEDPANKTYWEIGFFNDNQEAYSKYFLLLNKRCVPEIYGGEGDLRTVRFYFNISQLQNFNNWILKDVLTGEQVPFDKNNITNGVLFPYTFQPGEGKLFRLAPVMVTGGTFVCDESFNCSVNCCGNVYNNGYNMTLGDNAKVYFDTTDVTINMYGGSFTAGAVTESGNHLLVFSASAGKKWPGLNLSGCSTVSIIAAYFSNIKQDCYAVNLTNCFKYEIDNSNFTCAEGENSGGINAVYSSSNDEEEGPNNYQNIRYNTFNFLQSPNSAIQIICNAGSSVPLLMESNTIVSNSSSSTGILLSGVTGGHINKNYISNLNTGVLLLSSDCYFYHNGIVNSNTETKGIYSCLSGDNMNPSNAYLTSGFNYISNTENNSVNMYVQNSYFDIECGGNGFNIDKNKSPNHIQGYFPYNQDNTSDIPATKNCFMDNSNNSTANINVLNGEGGQALNFTTEPYDCIPMKEGDFEVIAISQGVYDTIYMRSGGNGGGQKDGQAMAIETQSGFKSLKDSININIRKRQYILTESQCERMLLTYPDSSESIGAISKLYLSSLSLDSAGSHIQPAKTFFETLILNNSNNTPLIKRANYFIQKCKVALKQYTSALQGFLEIINQNPYNYEGLIASWDYAATQLLANSSGSFNNEELIMNNDESKENKESDFNNLYSMLDSLRNKKSVITSYPAENYDKKKFTKQDREAINTNVANAFNNERSKQINKLTELEKQITTLSNSTSKSKSDAQISDARLSDAKKELKTMKTLGEIVKVKKPKTISEHIKIINADIKKVFETEKVTGNGKNNNILPTEYNLSQNYPNPFNPVTKINYELPKDGRVKLVIYDILGREIKTLVNELKQAGRYTVEFNGNNFASGVYFYRIQVEGGKSYTSVKKMVMIK
jgi:hypothetical protein